MFTRHVFYAILSLSLLLSFCSLETVESVSTEITMSTVQAHDEAERRELQELQHQIRRNKHDQILPQIMREYDVDMWIHVNRDGIVHSFGFRVNSGLYADLGSNSGVFIFTDHGGDRIERAVLGRRWKDEEPRVQNANDVVEESGACGIIVEAHERIELPGGPETEFDHRYKGIGEFAAERDPKRIAVNYLDKLGPHETSHPQTMAFHIPTLFC